MGRMPDQLEPRSAREPDAIPGVLLFPAPANVSAAPDVPRGMASTATGEQLLDALHAQLFESLLAYARAYGSADDAEDMVQNAFIALWDRHLQHGSDGRTNYEAYLFTAVRWRLKDRKRNRRSFLAVVDSYRENLESFTRRWMRPDAVNESGLDRVVRQARERMTDRARELHVLRFDADLSITEIMQMTGASRSTVSSLLSRANAILRRHLERAGYSPAAHRALNERRDP